MLGANWSPCYSPNPVRRSVWLVCSSPCGFARSCIPECPHVPGHAHVLGMLLSSRWACLCCSKMLPKGEMRPVHRTLPSAP